MSKLQSTLKEHKHRLTQARKEIYSLLEKSKRSLSAKEIHQQLSDASTTDLVSVYRNLSLFNELGLAHKFQDGSFAICKHEDDHADHQHVHFIVHCVECGRKSEIESHSKNVCDIARQLKKVSKPLKTFHEIIIQGHCAQCH